MRWGLLGWWLLLCYAVAGASSLWTAKQIPNWYRTLVRPRIAPPNWIFAPVWTTLYGLMAFAAWRVSVLPYSLLRSAALAFFGIQLALNLLWSLIFFRWYKIGWAVVEVLLLWSAILGTIIVFAGLSTIAAWLMVPYLLWVTFAAILNVAFWRLNRS